MSDSISVGGYGFQPIETTRPTSDRSEDDANQDPSNDANEEPKEQSSKKEPDQKRSPQQGVGDNIDLEA